MNMLIFLFQASPLVPIFVFTIIGGAGFYLLMVLGRKLLDRFSSHPEITKAIECLKAEAIARGGKLEAADSLTPELIFNYDDCKFTVSMRQGGRSLPSVTYATFQTKSFPDEEFRIASEKFKALISFTRIKDSNSQLNSRYELEGNSSAFLEKLLTPKIQENLMQYKSSSEIRFGSHRTVFLSLWPASGRFYFITEGTKTESKDYEQLIETTIMFYEQLKLLVPAEAAELNYLK